MVIAFFGPDGAGKSTQVDLLIAHLEKEKMRTRRAWIRAAHTYAYALSRVLIRAGYVRNTSNQNGWVTSQVDLKRIPALRVLWPWLEFFSMVPVILMRVKIPSFLGRVVVCERYTIDSIPSIAYMTGNEGFDASFVGRLLTSLVSPDYVLVNLDCDYGTLVSRRGESAESEEFIRIQRTMYSEIRRKLKVLYINTSSSDVTKTQSAVRAYVESRGVGPG